MGIRELRYLVDDTPQVLSTFGNVAASFNDTKAPTVKFPGIDFELSRVLHASEAVIVPNPLSTSSEPPGRATDFELSIAVSLQQALLYRMCGDRNPLHSDPDFACTAVFPGRSCMACAPAG